ncbi:MAG TPA: outer membrane beta-barrel protein [Polyangiaceae bacterium]|nr:outer membrane beta-barrel protein [Polyangiaceae bacterium]
MDLHHALLATLAVSAVAFSTGPLAAQPATANVIQLGGGFRYGFATDDVEPNPFGVGLGLELGYTLTNAVYLGANFDYFFGGSAELPGADVKANVWQLMAEGGYDIGLGDSVVLRPKLGAGAAWLNGEICNPTLDVCDDSSESSFAVAPGATFLYLGSSISLSLDLRYDIVMTDDTLNALIVSAGIGF